MASSTSWLTFISLFGSAVHVGGQILLLVVVAGAVRRHRPDAYGSLLAWAVASLVLAVVTPMLYAMANVLVGGIDSMVLGHAVVGMITTAFHVAVVVLLARGLVQLAQPAKLPNVDSGAAYR